MYIYILLTGGAVKEIWLWPRTLDCWFHIPWQDKLSIFISCALIIFDSLHPVDSVEWFVEIFPKAKLDCFSTLVLQAWWQAQLTQGVSKPHRRCIHDEAGIACNRRDWMECYTTNVFYVALACKLTHQNLKIRCIYILHIDQNNPLSLLLNVPQILKTGVHLQFLKISVWPIWLLIDPL